MDNVFFSSSIVNSYPELAPSIKRAPFDSDALVLPQRDKRQLQSIKNYLTEKFGNFFICEKGRSAIDLALSLLNLEPSDVVTVLTTSGNYYVSSCVTRTIEKHCKWSRIIENGTKAIIVVHEFGYIFKNVESLKKYNVPIIEDCASAFHSKGRGVGENGDFAIYSFPKAFSMRMGGMLVINNNNKYALSKSPLRKEEEYYILSCLEMQLKSSNEIISKRLFNYHYFVEHLADLGITPFFELDEGVTPEVFLFRWRSEIDFQKLKEFMQYNGIESSAFYGQPGFFIPVHHNLTTKELDYIINLLHYFYASY